MPRIETGPGATRDQFPVKGKSITGRHLSRYLARGQGVSTYTHVSDQHSTFDTKVIVATAPESHYVLDGLLGNETDLPVFEHATDTHGATLANFALFDLVGKQLSPRIRDLGKITLYRTGPKADFLDRYPRAGALPTRRLNLDWSRTCGTTCCASPPPCRAGTPPPRWWSASCAPRSGSKTR
jgi:hypothetical protein